MSDLLIDERPLVVLPKLAQSIGLNEAIVLQQIHWLCNSRDIGVEREGKRWIYNTPEGWRYWFPFFSKNTIRRAVDTLREMNLLTCKQLEGGQRPMFFRLSDSAPVILKRLSLTLPEPRDELELGKNATLPAQNGHTEHAQNGQASVPKMGNKRELSTRTLNDTDTNGLGRNASETLLPTTDTAKAVLSLLNELAGTDFRFVESNLSLIRNRMREHAATVEEISVMVRKKVAEWKGGDFEQYLRPHTLFGKEKFSSYFGQRNTRPTNKLAERDKP